MYRNVYEFDVENDIITIIVKGKRDETTAKVAAESVSAYQRYVASPTEGRRILVDFTRVTEVPNRAVNAIVAAHKQMNFDIMAIVRHNDWQLAFVDLVIVKTGKADKYRAFGSLEEARNWLVHLPRHVH